MPPSIVSVLLQGTLLGWSVAWPPGPINVEIARRVVSHGFRAGFMVGCGAFVGDFLWALLMNTGASIIAQNTTMKAILGVVSIAFLFLIVVMSLKNWWRRQNSPVTEGTSVVPPSRNGFMFGLIMSFTSPWNATFWLAIAGQSTSLGLGASYSFLLALSVMSGAAVWVTLLSTTASLGMGRIGGRWERHSDLLVATIMFVFAIQSIVRLSA